MRAWCQVQLLATPVNRAKQQVYLLVITNFVQLLHNVGLFMFVGWRCGRPLEGTLIQMNQPPALDIRGTFAQRFREYRALA